MDFTITTEQQLIVDTVRAFVEQELYPHETLVERENEVPAALRREIRDKAIAQGLYAANMPEELGGAGLDTLTLALMERELGRPNYALQAVIHRPSNILRACVDDQAEAYLKPTVRGDRIECLAMTEPGAGSDLRSMTTQAVPNGGDYVINGSKHFISHADVADFVILFAATGVDLGIPKMVCICESGGCALESFSKSVLPSAFVSKASSGTAVPPRNMCGGRPSSF